MSLARRLSQAGLLTGLAALTALACGSDTISLLPALAGSGGLAGSSGDAAGGTTDGGGRDGLGDAGRGNAAGLSGGGTISFGGSGCSGPACGGFGNVAGIISFGGATCFSAFDNCTPCSPNGQCPSGLHCSQTLGNVCVWCTSNSDCAAAGKDSRCDVTTGRCAPSCESSVGCADGRVCDMAQGTCVACVQNEDCERRRPDMPYCHLRRCVECEVSDDCLGPGRRYCFGYHCLECLSDRDCFGGKFCDNGHCQ